MTYQKITSMLACALLTLSIGCKSDGDKNKEGDATPKETTVAPESQAATSDKAPESTASPIDAAIAHELRPEEERARDAFRHPKETLEFFGVDPEDHVLELWAGGGWYTRVLTPYVATSGKLYVTSYPADSERDLYRKFAAQLQSYLGKVEGGDKVVVYPLNPPAIDIPLEDKVDVVLTFRNVHNWVKGGYDKDVYAAAFKALKPGGTFGVVEHRGPEGMTREESAKSGYMDQATVIADIESVGFKLVETSEINANPKDTADHPEGVWTLPPRLRLGDTDREKYVAIGESDRMTLKFVKPEVTE